MTRYCISDRRRQSVLETARRSVAHGVEMFQVREKDIGAAALLDLVRSVLDITRGSETRVLVNDRLDVALAAGAQGVHLPADGLPLQLVRAHIGLIGISTHSVEEVRRAEADGADFVVFGPVFDTPGKTPTGIPLLNEACQAVRIPVLAIGGMTRENSALALRAGAAGVAGIRMFQG